MGVFLPGVFIPGLFIPGLLQGYFFRGYLFREVFIPGLFIPGLFIHGGVYSGVIYSGGVYSGGVYSELFIPGLFIPVTPRLLLGQVAIDSAEYHALRIFYTVTLLRNDDILHNFKSNTHLGEKWVSKNETLQFALCLSLEIPTIYAYQRH